MCINEIVQMSDLITRRRAVTTTQGSEPPTQVTAAATAAASAATAPALMDRLAVGPAGSQAPASSASSVAQPVSARRRHRPASTTDATSTDASGSQPGIVFLFLHLILLLFLVFVCVCVYLIVQFVIYLTFMSSFFAAKKNTRGPCRQLKTAKVTRVTNSRINIGYDERHRAAPTAELHSSLAHDIGHVIRSYCPMQWKSWKVMPDETKTEVRGQLSVCRPFHSFSFKR